MLVWSVVVDGVCANATVASNAEPITPAVMVLADMDVLPGDEIVRKELARLSPVPREPTHIRRSTLKQKIGLRQLCAAIVRHDVVADAALVRTRPNRAGCHN